LNPAWVEKEREMVATERKLLRKKLDREMRFYRLAGRQQNPTSGLLRAVRQALKVPLKEVAGRLGVGESNVFELEEREETGSITLRSLGRMAEAMGCKVVYGIVPANGKTLEEMAEERLWKRVLGDKDDASGAAHKAA
jgi:predicted DNA-binding mobile mystery protein A